MTSTVRSRLLRAEPIGDVLLVQFASTEILEVHDIALIGRQLAELIENGHRKVLLSFRGVDRLSSLLAGKLVGLHRKMAAAGGQFVLCSIDPELYEIFDILRLPRLLKIHRTESVALERLQNGN